jgi:Protein of unknown function (DUF3102)
MAASTTRRRSAAPAPSAVRRKPPTLPQLARTANRQHALVRKAGTTMVESAITAGAALIAAKAQMEHGTWLAWVRENLDFSERTAQVYMRVAANPQRTADLSNASLNAAMRALQASPLKKSTRRTVVPRDITELVAKLIDATSEQDVRELLQRFLQRELKQADGDADLPLADLTRREDSSATHTNPEVEVDP